MPWAHQLNEQHAAELSSLSADGFAQLVATAHYAKQVRPHMGFLIAFDHAAQYASQNYQWFKQRYETFLYIDRVVVEEKARGQGVATALYDDLFSFAKEQGHSYVVCEVNTIPPNPESMLFHQRLGFKQIGFAQLKGAGKEVAYLLWHSQN